MKTLLSTLTLLPALVLPAAPATRTETRVEPLAMGARLWLTQRDGNVDIQGWDRPEVQIVALCQDGPHGARAELEVRRMPQGLAIEVKEPRAHGFAFFRFRHGARCHLTLMVPRQLSLAAKTVDGHLFLRNLDGYADLHSVDGAIHLEDVAGEVHARTVDGALEARRLKARLQGSTVDGRILLEQVEGGIALKTVDGAITALDLDGWGEGIRLASVDGNITVRLGAAKGRLEARAKDGAIRTGHPTLLVHEVRHNLVRGTIAGGAQEIRLSTVDGSIRID
jgi:hypothetical protein